MLTIKWQGKLVARGQLPAHSFREEANNRSRTQSLFYRS